MRLIYVKYRYKHSSDKQREFRRGILVDEASNIRLSAALAIDRRLDGIDLCQVGPLWLDGQAADEIGQSKRIGITRAPDSPLRFYVRGNRFVSGPLALNR